jgi:cytochrome c-type biogenesis protein CcmH/NrfF
MNDEQTQLIKGIAKTIEKLLDAGQSLGMSNKDIAEHMTAVIVTGVLQGEADKKKA